MQLTGARPAVSSSRDQRSQVRFDVALPALASVAGEKYAVCILNLTADGAMIRTAAPVRLNMRITIHCGTIESSATVIWQSGCLAGLKFDRALLEKEVKEQIARSSAISARRQLKRH
jgi:hypothetical protein